MKTAQGNVITIEEAHKRSREIPAAWRNAIGILKGKRRTSPVAYQRKIRAEWSRRSTRKTQKG